MRYVNDVKVYLEIVDLARGPRETPHTPSRRKPELTALLPDLSTTSCGRMEIF